MDGTIDERSDVTNPLVLFVGRLEPLKGVPVLLEAAQLVLKRMPHVRFVLAGGNHPTLTKESLSRLVQQFSLNGQVEFVGYVPSEQLIGWYRRVTLCVLPSYYETFGIAALESMAFGVPVVATRVGGLPEVIVDGVTGFLVAPGNSHALAEKIICLLRDKPLLAEMGQAGRERVKRFFDVESIADLTLKVYRQDL